MKPVCFIPDGELRPIRGFIIRPAVPCIDWRKRDITDNRKDGLIVFLQFRPRHCFRFRNADIAFIVNDYRVLDLQKAVIFPQFAGNFDSVAQSDG